MLVKLIWICRGFDYSDDWLTPCSLGLRQCWVAYSIGIMHDLQ